MVALFILTITTLFLIPILNQVYVEKITVQQEKKGLYLLDQAITNWVYEEVSTLDRLEALNTIYEVTYLLKSDKLKACVTWNGKNNRYYERCGYAKK